MQILVVGPEVPHILSTLCGARKCLHGAGTQAVDIDIQSLIECKPLTQGDNERPPDGYRENDCLYHKGGAHKSRAGRVAAPCSYKQPWGMKL